MMALLMLFTHVDEGDAAVGVGFVVDYVGHLDLDDVVH